MLQLIFYMIYLVIIPTIIISNPATLDTSFNGTGYAIFSELPSTVTVAVATALQTDGKILAAGWNGDEALLIARYTTSGQLDPEFNEGQGYVTTQITTTTTTDTLINEIQAIMIDSEGRILVTGRTGDASTTESAGINSLFIARYLSNGLLDTVANGGTGFGNGTGSTTPAPGYTIITPILDSVEAINTVGVGLQIQSTGNIIVGGHAQFDYDDFENSTGQYIVLASFTDEGILDTSFSTNGLTITRIADSTTSNAWTSKKQGDDNILVAGWISFDYGPNEALIARFTSNGQLDTTFNNGQGYTSYQFSTGTELLSEYLALTTQTNDNIIVSGYTLINGNNTFITARYLADGTFDTTFNPTGSPAGAAQLTIGDLGVARGVFCQPSGKIITTGYSQINGIYNLILIHYLQNGQLDREFSNAGYLLIEIENENTLGYASSVQSHGKITSVGQSNNELLVLRNLSGSPNNLSTSATTVYGYNDNFISTFLYTNFYATIITNAEARAATLDSVNSIINNYISDYANQPYFNYLAYLYLINDQLNVALEDLVTTYPDVSIQIRLFFTYIKNRILTLI